MSELAERYFEKALDAVKTHNYDRALGLLVEAIKLKPDFTEAWVVRGNITHAVDRPLDAVLHYDRALSIDDSLHDAWNNRGIAFGDIGMWAAAEDSFRKSAALCEALEPHMGLANMYCTLMRLPEAAAEYRKAIEHGAGPDAHFNLGVTLLGMGKWLEGFQEYEHRWANTPYPPRAYRNYRKWRGEDLNGKNILLYPEQGYGDEIMSLRLAEAIKRQFRSAFVIVEPRGPMRRLTEWFAVDRLPINDRGLHGPWTPHFSSPLLDVPMALGPRIVEKGETWLDGWLDTKQEPYLKADAETVADWRARLAPLIPRRLNVGLCWSSGGHLNTARAAQMSKSIPWQWLKPLAMDGVRLISLQKPAEKTDLPIDDWTDELHDFADTAALIETLDLVISVDTAVAHLAGALGKPVWNFVRYSGYWPWLAPDVVGNPEKSIWYPSMKLLRQPSLGNWDEPIKRSTAWLEQMVGRKAA